MAKKKKAGHFKFAVAGAVLFSLFAMSPVLSHFSTRKFGPNISGVGSDSYGFLYGMWVKSQPVDGMVRSETRDLITGYPQGRVLDFHIQVASRAAYTLAQAGLTPAAAYNFLIMLCFFLAFLISYKTLALLGAGTGPALLGAFITGLLPYQSLQAVDHMDLANTGAVLLDTYLLARLLVHRDYRAVPALIVLTGLAVFTHPYYLICLVIINACPLLWFAQAVLRREIKLKSRHWLGLAGACIASAAAVWFWKSLFVNDQGGIDTVERGLQDLYVYSTKIWDLILPPHFSRLFSPLTTSLKTTVTQKTGTNFVENTLYPGFAALVAMLCAAGWSIFHYKKTKEWVRKNPGLAFLLANTIVIPVACSISPTFDIFGFDIPMPSLLIHKVLPQYRTMSRIGYVTSVGLVLAFILILEFRILPKIRGTTKRTTALVLIALFCVFDFGYLHDDFYSDTELVPQAYTYLRDSTPKDAVIFEAPFMWGYLTTYWQSYHHRRNFAWFEFSHPNFQSMMATSQMDLGALVRFAKERRIDYLILHTSDNLQIPGVKFENNPDFRWLFFVFARYSYVIKVADL